MPALIGQRIDCSFTTVDPKTRLNSDVHNKQGAEFQIIKSTLQEVDLTFFDDVDFLFIDSSHVAKIGSDVTTEILEIMPRLPSGVIVHWHDIFLPHNYPQDWIENANCNMFWNENYVLGAFLSYNSEFSVTYAGHFLQSECEEFLLENLPFYKLPARLSSLWAVKNGRS